MSQHKFFDIALFLLLLACVLVGLNSIAQADTIIKLDLGGSGPDIGMNAGGTLATIDDGDAVTVGDQDT